MKRLYTLCAALAAVLVMNAQVSVTYQVDITDYLANGNVLGENGMRIGGNFAATGATTSGSAVAEWTPTDPSCAMTDMGDNIWSITIDYPGASVGMEQLYKFVNNDWGTNEGTDENNTIGADACGIDDGAGNVNRTLSIPGNSIGLQYCFDACFTCAGGDPMFSVTGIEELVKISGLNVSPNPAEDMVTFQFDMDKSAMVSITMFDILGSEVAVISEGQMAAGQRVIRYDAEALSNGTYFYRIQAGTSVTTGKLIKF